ncbi:MAG: metal-sensitive transcriptional regulator [Patescibacteria group bacterium]
MTQSLKKSNQEKALKLAKQASGTLQKVMQMIEEDKYCPDIIQQIEAVNGLLRSAKRELLQGHLNHCLEKKIAENKDKTIEELIKIYNLNQ